MKNSRGQLLALEHWNCRPIEQLDDRGYRQGPCYKPDGLWVSVKGAQDWPEWLAQSDWGRERLNARHVVELVEDASILLIEGGPALEAFTKDFLLEFQVGNLGKDSFGLIDWRRVAAMWDGIIIAPYCWTQRLSLSWYYGWDCASGCIWGLSAIKRFYHEPLEVERTKEGVNHE